MAAVAPAAIVGTVGDPRATRIVYAVVITLAVLGLVLVVLAIWLVRSTKVDLEMLAPLERMGDRSWRKRDPATQHRMLDEVRPDGAAPVWRSVPEPEHDEEFDDVPEPVGFDDLQADALPNEPSGSEDEDVDEGEDPAGGADAEAGDAADDAEAVEDEADDDAHADSDAEDAADDDTAADSDVTSAGERDAEPDAFPPPDPSGPVERPAPPAADTDRRSNAHTDVTGDAGDDAGEEPIEVGR